MRQSTLERSLSYGPVDRFQIPPIGWMSQTGGAQTSYPTEFSYLYRVYQKKCPEHKIASKLDNCKITDHQQQPTANIGHQVCISVNFIFICSILLAGGSSKCLIFKWLFSAKNFKLKMIFFVLPENMECCY